MEFLAPDLRGLFALCLVPAFLVLHRTEVTQARMQSAVIVEGHPVHDDLLSLLPGCKALPVHARRLEPAPEAFGGRVVPTIAFAAHG